MYYFILNTLGDNTKRVYIKIKFKKLKLSLYIYFCGSLLNLAPATFPEWLIMSSFAFLRVSRPSSCPTYKCWVPSEPNCFNVACSFSVLSLTSSRSMLLKINQGWSKTIEFIYFFIYHFFI